MKHLVYILLILAFFQGKAQNTEAGKDSLELVFHSDLNDSIKFRVLGRILQNYEGDYELRKTWLEAMGEIAAKINRKDLLAYCDFLKGTLHYDFSKYDVAVNYYYAALPVAEELNLLWLQSKIYNYLGIISSDQGNSKKAIYYFKKTYAIAVKLNDISQQFVSANNIGVDYNTINYPSLALYYLNISENIALSRKAYYLLPSIAGNKMECYFALKDLRNAKIQLDSLNVYIKKDTRVGGHESSLNYFTGYYFHQLKDYQKAIPYFKKNMELAEKSDLQELRRASRALFESYYALKDYKNSFDYLLMYQTYHDSLSSSDKLRATSEVENKYKTFKTEKELEIQKLTNQNQTLKLKRNRVILILTAVILALLIIGFGFVYKLFTDKRKANKILEYQNEEISIQKKEILDSINYSKRIQDGILPSEEELIEKVGEHFVFYNSKDIVSGDFYWAANRGADKFIIACCDSTGHGVPGAFMSLLGYSLLTKSEESNNKRSPAEILNYLNTELPKVFKSTNKSDKIKDGMDMSICEVDRKKLVMKVGGANNSVYHITNNELRVIKAQKHAISADISLDNFEFENKEILLEKGDLIVMFTDGYADQFGGPKGKKFKYKQLEDILLKNKNLTMKELQIVLADHFYSWKGSLEQVDDVCIIGIRI